MTTLKRPIRMDPCLFIADIVALLHAGFAVAFIVVGETTSMMNWMRTEHPGVNFVYHYLDAPVYGVLVRALPWIDRPADSLIYYLGALLIVAAASIFYALVVFIVLKILKVVFGEE
jgi:hypothetical protein